MRIVLAGLVAHDWDTLQVPWALHTAEADHNADGAGEVEAEVVGYEKDIWGRSEGSVEDIQDNVAQNEVDDEVDMALEEVLDNAPERWVVAEEVAAVVAQLDIQEYG